jgi:tRNA-specific 2-thiouridylase
VNARPVLVAMSGGVDSSVTAALLQAQGYDVTGVTMKLWGGTQDSGCCSVSDVEDARRVADQLGVPHHVFNFGDDFERLVVEPYVDAHSRGSTPNPCIECNRHLKFDKLLRRATALGFDLVATGHHARVVATAEGLRIGRGADAGKDQSYVLHMLDQERLARVLLPLGDMVKDDVRRLAGELGLRTADKPDSQDVCFIAHTSGGRRTFLEERTTLTPGRVVDGEGVPVGAIDAVELVTIGQRKGLGVSGEAEPRYATDVDMATATVTIGPRRDLFVTTTAVNDLVWVGAPAAGAVQAQISAHGGVAPAVVTDHEVQWVTEHRKVAPGQSVVFYQGDLVVGSATAA